MKIGEYVKVHLPGEWPWAKVTKITKDGFKGKIANTLVAEGCEFERRRISKHLFGTAEPMPVLHNYKLGDTVNFTKDEYDCWSIKEKDANF